MVGGILDLSMDRASEDDFYSLVVERRTRDCWFWRGDRTDKGRPIFRGQLAARVMHLLQIGEIPEGFEVHHMCQDCRCVNPGHLKALSEADHILWHSTKDKTIRDQIIRGNGDKIRKVQSDAAQLKQDKRDEERAKLEEEARVRMITQQQAFNGALNQAKKPATKGVGVSPVPPNIQAEGILDLVLRKQKEFRQRGSRV